MDTFAEALDFAHQQQELAEKVINLRNDATSLKAVVALRMEREATEKIKIAEAYELATSKIAGR